MAETVNIGRVRAAIESSFATDGTGTMGNFFSVRTDVGKTMGPAPKQIAIAVDPMRSFRGDSRASELGFKNTSMTVGGQLCSVGTEIGNGVTTTKDGISKIGEAIFGGYRTAEGSAVASGGSTTGCVVSAGDGVHFLAGQIIFVETAAGSGLYQPTFVQSRSTDTLTFGLALSFSPANTAKVLNTQMLFETDQPTSTLQWLVEFTRDRDRIFLYAGCAGNFTIEWPLGQPLMWSSQQDVTTWIHDDELATPQGGSALSVAYSYDAGTPVIGRGNTVHFGPANASTRVTPDVAEITFDPGVTNLPIPSHNGTEGRAGYERASGEAVATITVKAGTETYKDAHAAGTEYRLFAQAGNLGGKQIALHLPRCQIVDIEFVEVGGLDFEKLTLRLLPANGFADQQTDVFRSRFYLGRG